jgi:hypothetical protein
MFDEEHERIGRKKVRRGWRRGATGDGGVSREPWRIRNSRPSFSFSLCSSSFFPPLFVLFRPVNRSSLLIRLHNAPRSRSFPGKGRGCASAAVAGAVERQTSTPTPLGRRPFGFLALVGEREKRERACMCASSSSSLLLLACVRGGDCLGPAPRENEERERERKRENARAREREKRRLVFFFVVDSGSCRWSFFVFHRRREERPGRASLSPSFGCFPQCARAR